MREMQADFYEADFGAGLLKKRVARPGGREIGGFRILVATNRGGKWFFVFGFPKNSRANIAEDEQEALKKLSAHLLSLSPAALSAAQHAGELLEVVSNAEE